MSLKRRLSLVVASLFAGISAATAQSTVSPAQWYARAPLITTQPIPNLDEFDFANAFTLVSDSLGVYFNRHTAQVVRVNLRTGQSQAFGRSGNGPMEYSNICVLHRWLGDSILVNDMYAMRATVLSVQNGKGRQFRYSTLDSVVGSRLDMIMEGGVAVVRAPSRGSQIGPDGYFLDTARVRFIKDGISVREPVSYVSGSGARLHYGSNAMVNSPPYDLSLGAMLDTRRMIWFDKDSMHVWHVDGTSRTVPMKLPEHLLSAAARRDALEEWFKSSWLSPEAVAGYRRVLKIPERVPAVSRLYTSPGDRMWMRVETTPGSTEGATIIEVTEVGQLARCFKLSPTQRLLGLGVNVAITADKSEDDTYRVRKGAIPPICPVKGKFY